MKTDYSLLYVDDEKINLRLFEALFRNKFNVLIADSAKSGLESINSNSQIEIVISDMRMPVMNGLEFIREAHRRKPGLIFFILTGYEITEEIQAAINEGLVVKYFSKPLNVADIEKSILLAFDK